VIDIIRPIEKVVSTMAAFQTEAFFAFLETANFLILWGVFAQLVAVNILLLVLPPSIMLYLY